MHNHLKKLLFGSNNNSTNHPPNTETEKPPREKRIKYIYKNDFMAADSSHKARKSSKRRSKDESSKKHRKKVGSNLALLTPEELRKYYKTNHEEEGHKKSHRTYYETESILPQEYNKYFLIEKLQNSTKEKNRSQSVPAKFLDEELLLKTKKRKEKKNKLNTSEKFIGHDNVLKKNRSGSKDHHHHKKRKKSAENINSIIDKIFSPTDDTKKGCEEKIKEKKEKKHKTKKMPPEHCPLSNNVFNSETCHPYFFVDEQEGTSQQEINENASKQDVDNTKMLDSKKSSEKCKKAALNLVQTVFSLVDIKPQIISQSQKNKGRNYNNYYVYVDDSGCQNPQYSSDCHKNYNSPGCSIYEEVIVKKTNKWNKSGLKTEMHVNEVQIIPAKKRDQQEQADSFDKKKENPSKIPVPSPKLKRQTKIENMPSIKEKLLAFETCSKMEPDDSIPDLQHTYRKEAPNWNEKEETETKTSGWKPSILNFSKKKSSIGKPLISAGSLPCRFSNFSRNDKFMEQMKSSFTSKRQTEKQSDLREKHDVKVSKKISSSTAETNKGYSKKKSTDKQPKGTVSGRVAKIIKPLSSKSDTKMSKDKTKTKKTKRVALCSSHSTLDKKSVDSDQIKRDDKWLRWKKRKEYSDSIRKQLIRRKKRAEKVVPEQVMEVRYLTVETNANGTISPTNHDMEISTDVINTTDRSVITDDIIDMDEEVEIIEESSEPNEEELLEEEIKRKSSETLKNEMVPPLELDKYVTPIEEVFEEIINENFSFLQKDFTVTFTKISYSSAEETSDTENEKDVWEDASVCEDDTVLNQSINYSGDRPGSVESGYSTIKSKSFFRKPNIKALLEFPPPIPNEVPQRSEKSLFSSVSSLRSIEICSIESIAIQTEITLSEKSSNTPEDTIQILGDSEPPSEAQGMTTIELESDDKVNAPKRKNSGYKMWLNRARHVFKRKSRFSACLAPNKD